MVVGSMMGRAWLCGWGKRPVGAKWLFPEVRWGGRGGAYVLGKGLLVEGIGGVLWW